MMNPAIHSRADQLNVFTKMTYTIESWYDRSIRLWTCLWLDEEGNQHGIAQYATIRGEMKELVAKMKITYPTEYQI
jgi:hypothetical protein